MANELKRRAEDVVRQFVDLGDFYAEKVVAVNEDGSEIGGGGAGGGTEFAEDSAAAGGALGTLALAVRRDALASAVSADGDYSELQVDNLGRLKISEKKDAQVVGQIATIGAGTALSTLVDLRYVSLVGLQTPAAWTAAAITFSVSIDNVTFVPLYDDAGTERSITVAASRLVTLDPGNFMGAPFLMLRSGTFAAPVNQAAERSIFVSTVAL